MTASIGPADVEAELTGTTRPALQIYQGSGMARNVSSLQDKVEAAVTEATLFLAPRTLVELAANAANADTVLGHSINAASYGRVVNAKLDLIAKSLKVDVSAVK